VGLLSSRTFTETPGAIVCWMKTLRIGITSYSSFFLTLGYSAMKTSERNPTGELSFPRISWCGLRHREGSPQQTGCDWKGSPRPLGATVKWGVMLLTCTDVGWIRVEVKGMNNAIF
jgi:hypothetical protein